MPDTAETTRPISNLSVRIRLRPGETRLPRRTRGVSQARKTINYSAGAPVSIEPPITVGADPLLERLKGGQR